MGHAGLRRSGIGDSKLLCLLLFAWAAVLLPALLTFHSGVISITVPGGAAAVAHDSAIAAPGGVAVPHKRATHRRAALERLPGRTGIVNDDLATREAAEEHSSSMGAGTLLQPLPEVFLFIGILSGAHQEERRAAVREAWATEAQSEQVVARFVMSEFERTAEVEAELQRHGDIVFCPQPTDYSTISYKTYHVRLTVEFGKIMEHAVTQYSPAFILKTDDDAFVNVAALLRELRTLCTTSDCRGGERLYLSHEIHNGTVVLEEGHKWQNRAFANHSGLSTYPAYMSGGGYVLSGDVAATLTSINKNLAPLKHTSAEDVSMAMWLLPLDIRRVDHPKFWTGAEHCCLQQIERKRVIRLVGEPEEDEAAVVDVPLEDHLQINEEAAEHLCGPAPWLVTHKLEPDWVRLVGRQVAACRDEAATAAVIAPLEGQAATLLEPLPLPAAASAASRKEG